MQAYVDVTATRDLGGVLCKEWKETESRNATEVPHGLCLSILLA